MTAKEKAKQLVNRFRPFAFSENGRWDASTYNSKWCAIIAVDEMLEVICAYADISKDYEYWQEVKKEIEKL